MENWDREKERRVWQRVQGQPPKEMPPLGRESWKAWILLAQENGVCLRSLSLQLIGKQWEPLRRLELENNRMVQSMRGLSALAGESIKLTPLASPKDVPRRALEKCFHRSRRLWEEFTRRSNDPEVGMVCQSLAQRAADHCATLAELVGKLEP